MRAMSLPGDTMKIWQGISESCVNNNLPSRRAVKLCDINVLSLPGDLLSVWQQGRDGEQKALESRYNKYV